MSTALVWFRQDLRCSDNPAFSKACNENRRVIPVYIRDDATTAIGGAQRWWLYHSLVSLQDHLAKKNGCLALYSGDALSIILRLVSELGITKVYWNRRYEPNMIQQDTLIKKTLIELGIEVFSSSGSLLNEPWTIKNQSGGYFKVFTPYWKHCLQKTTIPPFFHSSHIPEKVDILSESLSDWNLLPTRPNWASGFSEHWSPGEDGAQAKLETFIQEHLTGYTTNRDFPAEDATSKLSPHLHFGEISPWAIWRAIEEAKLYPNCDWASTDRFLAELGWREFSNHLLYHLPNLSSENFKKEFDAFPWHTDEAAFQRWQKGLTGYPIVDAGMRELWATGYMHNRVRMIVASFLTKHLLMDWRLGATWFLDTLVDADMANNSASWQWVAGCGADAAPYFRIFNPTLQSEKFDSQGIYIRRWVPELANVKSKYIHEPRQGSSAETGINLGKDYPYPMVDHQEARKTALEYYKNLKG